MILALFLLSAAALLGASAVPGIVIKRRDARLNAAAYADRTPSHTEAEPGDTGAADEDLDAKWSRYWLNRELEDRAVLDADAADWAGWLAERAAGDVAPVQRIYEEFAGAAVRQYQQAMAKLGHTDASLKIDAAVRAAYDQIGEHEAPVTPMSIVDTCSWSALDEAVLREAERILDEASRELVTA